MNKRTMDGNDAPTSKADFGNDAGRPAGVRPPPRPAAGITPKTAQYGGAQAPGAGEPSAPSRFSDQTQVFSQPGRGPAAPNAPARPGVAPSAGSMTGGHTQLVLPGSSAAKASDEVSGVQPVSAQTEVNGMHDPVHGWLVVVDGPGKGFSLQVGGGRSSVGRGEDQSISINFGDETISREKHCWVIYDSKSKKFHLAAGDGRNLVYVNGDPVLNSLELKNRDEVTMGDTTLRFVSFCGEDFDW